ncbi:MAG: YeeE/YedE family protein [Aquabacterium sp.]
MTIAWNDFTPWAALSGGILIGLSAALLVLLNGRVAGVSSVLGGLLRARTDADGRGWRLAFIGGLLLAPLAYAAVAALPASRIDAGWGTLVAAGLLVGVGTRYAGGCTSGHGVCGLSRLSPRSLVATLVFMGAGFAAVYVVRHLLAAG